MSELVQVLSPDDILKKLGNDPDGKVRDAAIARMREKAAEVKRALDRGVPPDDYLVMTKALAVLEAAPAVVAKAWLILGKLNQSQTT